MRTLHVLVFFLLFFPRFSGAQEKTEGAPVTIEISSKYLFPGKEYTLSGQTETGNKSLSVKIEILSRSSSVLETENVQTDEAGNYRISRKAPVDKGIYLAKVTGADDKMSDTVSFVVVGSVEVSKALAEHFDKPVQFAQKGLEAANAIVKDLPPSAAKEEFKEKYEKVSSGLSELAEQSNGVKREFVKLMEIASRHPAVLAETDAYIDELDSEIEKMKEHAEKFARQVFRKSQEKVSSCERLNVLIEVADFASLMLNFQGSIAQILLNLSSSKVLAGAINRALPNHENEAFAINAAQGAVFSQVNSFKKLLLHVSGPGFMLDLASFIWKKIYNKFCEEMKGPFTGRFYAEFKGEGHEVWEKYSMDMKGNLTLRYGKGGNSQTGFAVTGEFEGLYTDYDFWADVTLVEPLPKNIYVVSQKVITPPPLDYSIIGDDMGLLARQMIPGSFYIKVKGVVKEDVLTLKMDEEALINKANVGLSNRIVFVTMNPALPIPLVNVFTFPMAPAQSVFVVGMDHEGEKFQLKTKNGKTFAKKKIDNNRRISNNEIFLKTVLDISIESPGQNEP